jgi:hypothetical protein
MLTWRGCCFRSFIINNRFIWLVGWLVDLRHIVDVLDWDRSKLQDAFPCLVEIRIIAAIVCV